MWNNWQRSREQGDRRVEQGEDKTKGKRQKIKVLSPVERSRK
jgi:hypothetical protein